MKDFMYFVIKVINSLCFCKGSVGLIELVCFIYLYKSKNYIFNFDYI